MREKKRTAWALCLLAALWMAAGCGGRDQERLENEIAYREIGMQKLAEGSYQEAVDNFQKALDQSVAVVEELEVDICYYKAEAQLRGGDAAGAIETYTALLEYDKKNAQAQYLRGTAYLMQGQTAEALADYREAVKKEKNSGALYGHIAENLIRADMSPEAEEFLKAGEELGGETAAELAERGYLYLLKEDYDRARANLDKAIALGDQEAVFYLAKVEDAVGNSDQAMRLYETYLSTHGNDVETLNELGCARLRQGNYDQALKFFQTALAAGAGSSERQLRRNEIVALEYLLDFAQAKEKLQAYLADYPDDADAAREWEFLQSR